MLRENVGYQTSPLLNYKIAIFVGIYLKSNMRSAHYYVVICLCESFCENDLFLALKNKLV